MKTIGVTSIDPWFVLDDDPLIKDLYYFDKLAYTIGSIPVLEKFCKSFPKGGDNFKKKMEEIERLEKAGLIYEYTDSSFTNDKMKHGTDQSTKLAVRAMELSLEFTTKEKAFKDIFVDFLERFREVGQLNARVYSIVLNNKDLNVYTPIIRSNYYNFEATDLFSNSSVLTVILSKFPTPSEDIELEKLVNFKNDPDTQLKLARLKDWILEISKKNYSEKEIEQKIDYLLLEYTTQLDLHKLKYNLGYIETFVTISLEVLENVVKLNLSKAAKVLFNLSKKNINLLEAEQKLIGKELAFVHKLNNKNYK